MVHGDWDTDSDYRQFNPGLYAMRQLGRSVSRHTRRVLQPGRMAKDETAHESEPETPTHSAYEAAYRRGPPMPSGIHRRSVSFDNLVLLPGTIPRRSTEPAPESPRNQPDLQLPSASTWNSGTIMTRAAAGIDNNSSLQSAHPNASMRRAWMAGLAHPLSTAIGSEYHAQNLTGSAASASSPPMQIRFADDVALSNSMRQRTRYRERESFSGPAQLDASANLTDSQNSVPNSSDPFQNRHMWQHEDGSGERMRPHTSAELRQHTDAQIVPSSPISSGLFRRPSGRAADEPSQKVRGIARVIGNISRRLGRIRSGRSASQPATPAEVQQSIMDSARQNMIHVPNDTGHEFYRFFVNPEEPVSDHDGQPDSPTISSHMSPRQSNHRRSSTFPSQRFAEFKRSVNAEPDNINAVANSSAERLPSSLPPGELVAPGAPMLNNESFDHMSEDTSRNSERLLAVAPDHVLRIAESRELRRTRSADIVASSEKIQAPAQMTNQGHDGSISALVQAKLASEFSKNVRVSTRLISNASTESSYGMFVRFHPSGELNGIFATEGKRRSLLCQVQEANTLPSEDGERSPDGPAVSPSADANRYARNQESIRRFVDEVRAARQESVRRRRETEAKQRILNNNQAVLDASLYIHERQKRADAANAIGQQQQIQQQQPQIQQGNDVPTLSTVSAEPTKSDTPAIATVMPPRNRRRQSEGPGRMPARNNDSRRRETVFGMFCGPGRSESPEPKDQFLRRPAATGPPRRRSKRRPTSYMNKDLPPLPAHDRSGFDTPPEPMHASIRNTMKRSQSFSHFGAADSEHARWNAQPDTDDERLQRRRPGFLSGILSKFTGGHSRRKSSVAPETPCPRKLTRRPRNPRAIDDSAEDSDDVLDVVVHDESATPPNVNVSVPRQTLSAEICEDIVQNAASPALSSTHRRIYTNVLSSLSSPEDTSFDTSGSPQAPPSAELHHSGSNNLYPSLGLNASNVESSRSIGEVAIESENPPLTPGSRRTDGDRWRDSAVTGLLTQVSAATSKGRTGVPVVAEETSKAADEPEDNTEPEEQFTHAVRFRERRSIVERTSGVALDTITARDRSEWVQAREERGGKSLPHSHATSRIVSSNGSFADMIASASSEYLRQHRMPDLPGIEGFSRPESSTGPPRSAASSGPPQPLLFVTGLQPLQHSNDIQPLQHSAMDLPLPANEKLRQLESDVLFGGQRPRPTSADSNGANKMRTSIGATCDSPISETGTGRTRILDFAETNINPDNSTNVVKSRRPSARPEIKDVRSILWSEGNSESAAALGRPAGLGLVDTDSPDTPTALNSLERTTHSGSGAPDFKSAQMLLADESCGKGVGTPESFPKQSTEEAEANERQRLARLVQRSPDPRNLIYDAGSQFGSMRSHESRGTDVVETKAAVRPPLPPDLVAAHNAATATSKQEPISPSGLSPGIGPDIRTPTDDLSFQRHMLEDMSMQRRMLDEQSLHRQSHQFGAGTDSEAMARASVQATMSESPGIAARRVNGKAPLAAVASPAFATQNDTVGRRMSFQKYVEQQKHVSNSRSTTTGNEQLNFRVSLLERKLPEFNRRTRSVSLPASQPALLAIADGRNLVQQSARQQRARSFYESPLLVQTLLLQQSEPSTAGISLPPLPATGRTMSQGADEDLEDRALFSTLLGDGAALTSPEIVAARRMSGARTPSQVSAPLAFDPQSDHGENGVPDSVLRAYMAGDTTAVERFFEHIMHLTAPTSVYDGEGSEDGDWSFGLEGPPPEILAQRAIAAKQGLVLESRDLPDMVDASADASRVISSGANIQSARTSDPEEHLDQSVSNQGETVDQVASSQVVPPVQPVSIPETPIEQPAATDTAVAARAIATNSSDGKEARKIAVPRSRLSRRKHTSSPNSNIALVTPDVSSIQMQGGKQSNGQIVQNDVVDIPVTVESTRGQQPTDNVLCFSPARMRGRNAHRQQSEATRRKPLPTQTFEMRRQENRMDMAKLRVLETIIQKEAIEESRLRPAPALQGSRLTEDIQSMESIYSINMEMDYQHIQNELSRSVRQRFEDRRAARDVQSRAIQVPPIVNNVAAQDEPVRVIGRGPDVLKRLKHGSQARVRSPFRASMLERAAITPELSVGSALNRPTEPQWSKVAEPATSASIPGGVPNMSLSDVAYSARSSGSIRIDIIDDRSIPGSPTSEVTSSHRAIRLSNTGRFRRTAKLLAL
ncbi:hypothetical protein GGH12_002057 [Coemansia sp. RSA 1822]|nr:hypothetical protein LPJ76_000945 [Coemansia sp. RSA 638]KAJ2564300.1 hypothetical protein GGH12_002057 [Coemansia sp. RSA 1822]